MSTTSQPLVSIVTPVYNEEENLAECIESILAQTYQNWDYTIVDNCSTDGSLGIARHYATKDSRIRVHENERYLEIVPNHNIAVRQISPASKYCKVVFGDDWIFPRCLQQMVAAGEEYPSAGIITAYQLFGQEIRIKGLQPDQKLLDGREACRQFLLDRLLLFGSPTSALYRSDLVKRRNPFYDETNMFPDFEVCFALLSDSDLGFVHELLTCCRPRARSAGAVSVDAGAQFRGMLDILFRYGGRCLTPEEFQQCLSHKLSQYYRFLGRRLWVEHDPDFWSYQKKTFAKAGVQFSHARLLTAAVAELCASVLHPKSLAASVRRLPALRKIRACERRAVALRDE